MSEISQNSNQSDQVNLDEQMDLDPNQTQTVSQSEDTQLDSVEDDAVTEESADNEAQKVCEQDENTDSTESDEIIEGEQQDVANEQDEPNTVETAEEDENPQPAADDDNENVENSENGDSAEDEEDTESELTEIAATIEAILFSVDTAMTPAKIVQVGELPGQAAVTKGVALLNERYKDANASFRIEAVAGGYQMMTLKEYHDVLERMFKVKSDSKLTQAAMETLAIVAYRQPILRADIEAIRGVASGEMLRSLMEKQMVKIVGRAEVLGRPMLYGTTRHFLEIFGLKDLKELPRAEELKAPEPKPMAKPAEEKTAEEAANPESEDAQDTPSEDTAPELATQETSADNQTPADQTGTEPDPQPTGINDEETAEIDVAETDDQTAGEYLADTPTDKTN